MTKPLPQTLFAIPRPRGTAQVHVITLRSVRVPREAHAHVQFRRGFCATRHHLRSLFATHYLHQNEIRAMARVRQLDASAPVCSVTCQRSSSNELLPESKSQVLNKCASMVLHLRGVSRTSSSRHSLGLVALRFLVYQLRALLSTIIVVRIAILPF